MNKFVASIGMAAVGASALQTASAQDLGVDPSKFWSVTATLRGFYDDNVNTGADGNEIETFGLEIAPGIGLAWNSDATTVSAGYRYSGKVYENPPRRFDSSSGETPDKWDHNHTFRLALDHAFSERYRMGLSDSFVVGQEPDAIRLETGAADQFQRISGDNIRNYASIFFNADLTPVFGAEVGYNNSFFDYDAEFNPAIQTVLGDVVPSNSGTLDRIEHTAYLEGQLQVRPATELLAGYQFGVVDYTADEPIRGIYPVAVEFSDVRNSRSHYGYLGVQHAFRSDLSGSVRAGLQHVDFYNEADADSEISPYVQAVLSYAYAPESLVRLGFTQRRTPIYVPTAQDADTSLVYGSIRHRIVPNLFGTLSGTFQHSSYNSDVDSIDGMSDDLFQLGVNLEYRFNAYFSGEVGYNYDTLDSELGANYDRNRVYIGVIARY